MKKLLFICAIIFPFAAFGQNDQPLVPGLFTDTITYTIYDSNGIAIDETSYNRAIGIPYTDAMILKYVRLSRCIGEETSVFTDVLKAGGDIKAVFDAQSK